jgi:cation diffusion facilitator family transporter
MKISQRKAAVAWLSVLSNTTLVAMKIAVGMVIGSVSILSEAIHSGVDLLASVIALVAVKTAARPADPGHPFGHGKVENISGTIEALLIFGAAVWIVYEAVQKFINPGEIDAGKWGWGAAVMLVSASANYLVSRRLFRVARETGSIALEADGWHLRTDVYTSVGVMAALGIVWAVEEYTDVNIQWLDPAAAIFVALLILRAAYEVTVRAAKDLMDVKLPADEEDWIRQLILGLSPTVRGFHRLRTRKSGPNRFVEFHMFVDGTMTVAESHRLSHELARKVEEHFPGSSVLIHVEPCQGNCQHVCNEECFLTEEQRRAVREGRPLPKGSTKSTGSDETSD